jgi:NAD(P)-dependent dehydrogenase (short-subunit alcohol dehydrogenase family)
MAETKQRPEDRLLHEMTCDPRGRRVWVAAGGTELGKALVQCLTEAGAEVADSQLDIVVNNVDVMGSAREQMEAHYFGLLRLSEQLTPRVAWVNILSIYALMSLPGLQGFAASMAAALSLSQSLRAEMQGRGVRVINVFPGPMETERYRAVALPKLHPVVLARAVTRALQDSVEDVYPGDVAQEWLARWRESPKALEREIAQ